MMRRAALVSVGQLYISIFIACFMILASLTAFFGLFSNRLSKYALNTNVTLLTIAILMTLFLGSYIWFESLNVRQSYENRWYSWPDTMKIEFQSLGSCCGFLNSEDNPVINSSCTQEATENQEFPGCSESVFEFINDYLQNIYSVLFAYVFAGIVAFLSSMMLIQIVKDQERAEKSMFKFINMYQLNNENSSIRNSSIRNSSIRNSNVRYSNIRYSARSTLRSSHRLSSYPANFKHSSVIYESKGH
ncbi:hypothetical protein K502DRAFT_167938 [Neoconidiobolus thromboides FSU 785]|nr:hypothetical protein K502DRAFT_167938 [Neoconidiobolus thromboides FSU 785]